MRSIVSQTFIHTITGSDIWLEADQINRALLIGGYDTTGLDLESIAIQAKVREVRDTTEYFNITVEELHWDEPNYHGDVEMRIIVPTDADHVMLRLAL